MRKYVLATKLDNMELRKQTKQLQKEIKQYQKELQKLSDDMEIGYYKLIAGTKEVEKSSISMVNVCVYCKHIVEIELSNGVYNIETPFEYCKRCLNEVCLDCCKKYDLYVDDMEKMYCCEECLENSKK